MGLLLLHMADEGLPPASYLRSGQWYVRWSSSGAKTYRVSGLDINWFTMPIDRAMKLSPRLSPSTSANSNDTRDPKIRSRGGAWRHACACMSQVTAVLLSNPHFRPGSYSPATCCMREDGDCRPVRPQETVTTEVDAVIEANQSSSEGMNDCCERWWGPKLTARIPRTAGCW